MSGSKPLGRLEFIPAKDLTMLKGLQRIPTSTRLRDFDPWDSEKEGIILVAQITDGRNKGKRHVYDGGSRVAYMRELDPDYPFRCWVLEMTQLEAARAFLAHNRDAKKPGAFARYSVGIHAGEKDALAIQSMLNAFGLTASPGRSLYGNGDGAGGEFAAFAAAERIVNNAYGETGSWPIATFRLIWVMKLCRETYPQHGDPATAVAHDADLIQSVALIAAMNPDTLGDELAEQSLRQAINTWYGTPNTREGGKFFEPRQVMKPSHWRLLAHDISQSGGGSESRGTMIAKLIVTNHNRHEHERPEGVGTLVKPGK